MRLTYKRARERLSRYVGDGMCESHPLVAQVLYEAQARLIDKGGWRGTAVRCVYNIGDCMLTLPPDVDRIIAAAGTSRWPVRSQYFEFVTGGSGTWGSSANLTLLERGDGVFQHSMPPDPRQLVAISTEWEDGATITFIGKDEDNREITESIGVVKGHTETDPPKLTAKKFSCVDIVEKTVTNGYVAVYAWDPSGPDYYSLAIYRPQDTHPSFRKMAVPTGYSCTTVDTISARKLEDLTVDTDLLVIQNEAALRLMLQCLKAEERNKTSDAQYFQGEALSVLNDELGWLDQWSYSPQLMNTGYGGGGVENL